jgi:hypothetical protein
METVWRDLDITEVKISVPEDPEYRVYTEEQIVACCRALEKQIQSKFMYCFHSKVIHTIQEQEPTLVFRINADYAPCVSVHVILITLVYPLFPVIFSCPEALEAPVLDGKTLTVRLT